MTYEPQSQFSIVTPLAVLVNKALDVLSGTTTAKRSHGDYRIWLGEGRFDHHDHRMVFEAPSFSMLANFAPHQTLGYHHPLTRLHCDSKTCSSCPLCLTCQVTDSYRVLCKGELHEDSFEDAHQYMATSVTWGAMEPVTWRRVPREPDGTVTCTCSLCKFVICPDCALDEIDKRLVYYVCDNPEEILEDARRVLTNSVALDVHTPTLEIRPPFGWNFVENLYVPVNNPLDTKSP